SVGQLTTRARDHDMIRTGQCELARQGRTTGPGHTRGRQLTDSRRVVCTQLHHCTETAERANSNSRVATSWKINLNTSRINSERKVLDSKRDIDSLRRETRTSAADRDNVYTSGATTGERRSGAGSRRRCK